jgi:hypothetical protein
MLIKFLLEAFLAFSGVILFLGFMLIITNDSER